MNKEASAMSKVMVQPASDDRCREAASRAFQLFPLEMAGGKVLMNPNALMAALIGCDPAGILLHLSVQQRKYIHERQTPSRRGYRNLHRLLLLPGGVSGKGH
jgi:hypothetical protein